MKCVYKNKHTKLNSCMPLLHQVTMTQSIVGHICVCVYISMCVCIYTHIHICMYFFKLCVIPVSLQKKPNKYHSISTTVVINSENDVYYNYILAFNSHKSKCYHNILEEVFPYICHLAILERRLMKFVNLLLHNCFQISLERKTGGPQNCSHQCISLHLWESRGLLSMNSSLLSYFCILTLLNCEVMLKAML